MKTEWAHRSIHNIALCYTLILDPKKFRKEMKRLGVDPDTRFLRNDHSNATCHLFQSKSGAECAVVCMPESLDRPMEQVYALLVHEAVHIWQHHCNHIGERFPSDEFMAYGLQAISQNLFELYQKQTKGKKRSKK